MPRHQPTYIHCKNCGMPLKPGTVICSYCHGKTGARRIRQKKERRTIQIFRWSIPVPWVTLTILLLNVLIGIWKTVKGPAAFVEYGMIQGSLEKGEWIRLLTSGFIHVNLPHLASNMYGLLVYGFIFENRISRWKYAVIYFVSLLGASLLINFIGGPYSVHIGASGAIFGLMTAYLVYGFRNRERIIFLLYALHGVAANIIYTFAVGISWQGHLGGAIAGVLIALVLFAKPEKKEKLAMWNSR